MIQTLCWVTLLYGMMIAVGPKLYSVQHPLMPVTYRSRTLAFHVFVLKT